MGHRRAWLRWVMLAGSALGWAGAAGQTLAHRNWEGSGLTVQPWWSRAIFCVAGGDLKRALGEMDALQRIGCDAVELSPGSGYGAAAEMDGLMEAAGRRKMRVVVDLALGPNGEQELRDRVAFWATRGAAGFAVPGIKAGTLRLSAWGSLRIADGENGDGQLHVRKLPEAVAAGLRAWLAPTLGARQGGGVLLENGSARLGYARSAMLLASGVAARIAVDEVLPKPGKPDEAREFSPEELLLWVPKQQAPPDGLEEWIRALSDLHHQNASLRAGQAAYLDFDASGVLGWVVARQGGRDAVLVICNLSGKAVSVPLSAAVRGVGIKGTSLKTLIRSDKADGDGDSLEGVRLGVDGVFVGEVR